MEKRTADIVKLAVKALEAKKASDISVIDISSLSVVADCFVIASADNIRQTAALCDSVEEVLGKAGFEMRQVEGRSSANWILMDYNDVIIHIFTIKICFFLIFTPFTITFCNFGITSNTSPVLPLSFPDKT